MVGVICANRIDPVAAKIINDYIPLANVGRKSGRATCPARSTPTSSWSRSTTRSTTAHRFTGSYFVTGGTNTVQAGTGNLPWASQQFNWRQHNVNRQRHLGPRLQQDQPGLVQLHAQLRRPPESARRRRWPIWDRRSTIQGAPSLPQITVSGFFTLTNAIGGPTAGGNFYSGRDVFSWTKGRHASSWRRALANKTIQDTLLNNYGVFTFNNSVTRNALADFLIGIPSAVTQDAPVTAYWNSWYGAASRRTTSA